MPSCARPNEFSPGEPAGVPGTSISGAPGEKFCGGVGFPQRMRNGNRFSGATSLSLKGEKQNISYLLSMPSRRGLGGNQGVRAMYTGTLIEELMATVERAEEQAREHQPTTEDVERWFTQSNLVLLEQNYQGVA